MAYRGVDRPDALRQSLFPKRFPEPYREIVGPAAEALPCAEKSADSHGPERLDLVAPRPSANGTGECCREACRPLPASVHIRSQRPCRIFSKRKPLSCRQGGWNQRWQSFFRMMFAVEQNTRRHARECSLRLHVHQVGMATERTRLGCIAVRKKWDILFP